MNKYLIIYHSEISSGNTIVSSDLGLEQLYEEIKRRGYFTVSGVETKTLEDVHMLIPYHSIKWIKVLNER